VSSRILGEKAGFKRAILSGRRAALNDGVVARLNSRMTAENAAITHVMIPFGARNAGPLNQSMMNFRCEQHSCERCREVNPSRGPDATRQRRDEGARGVNAHSGERRFERYVEEYKRAPEHPPAGYTPGKPAHNENAKSFKSPWTKCKIKNRMTVRRNSRVSGPSVFGLTAP